MKRLSERKWCYGVLSNQYLMKLGQKFCKQLFIARGLRNKKYEHLLSCDNFQKCKAILLLCAGRLELQIKRQMFDTLTYHPIRITITRAGNSESRRSASNECRWTIDNEGLQRRGRVVRCSREKDVSVCLWCSRSTSSFAKTHRRGELRITIDHCMWFTAWKYFKCEFCKFASKLVMSPLEWRDWEIDNAIGSVWVKLWTLFLTTWKKHAQRKNSKFV